MATSRERRKSEHQNTRIRPTQQLLHEGEGDVGIEVSLRDRIEKLLK
jgi:hypothetical protein